MLNTIVQIKLPDGAVIDLVDWTDKPIFSTADFQTGFVQQETSLFQYTTGATVPGVPTAGGGATRRTATDRDTNLSAPGTMASTEEMLVYAIKPEVYSFTSGTANDFTTLEYVTVGAPASPLEALNPIPSPLGLAIINQQLLLRLVISQKVYAEASIGYFNTGFGVYAPAGLDSVPGSGTGNPGFPSQEAVRSFVIPHHIGSQEKFRVNIVNPGGNAVNFGKNIDVTGGEVNLDVDAVFTIRVNLDGLYKRPTS